MQVTMVPENYCFLSGNATFSEFFEHQCLCTRSASVSTVLGCCLSIGFWFLYNFFTMQSVLKQEWVLVGKSFGILIVGFTALEFYLLVRLTYTDPGYVCFSKENVLERKMNSPLFCLSCQVFDYIQIVLMAVNKTNKKSPL